MSADNSTSASDRQRNSSFVPCSSRKRRRISPPPPIGKLADDHLLEILIRLPNPRYASRCKAVCKGWRSLISDPVFNRRFVSHHRSRNQQPPLLLPSDDPQSIITSFLPPMSRTDRRRFTVLDSFKGLLLCGFADVSQSSELGRSYLVCNPVTKQWVALPLAPELPPGGSILSRTLACEPSISYNLDLGDDQVFVYSEYRFRVVRLYLHEGSTKVDVFCSDSREWTKGLLVLDGRYYLQSIATGAVSCNGELFWLYAVASQDPDDIHLMKLCIAAFNPFRPDIPPTAIDVPPIDVRQDWDISVSQGALHIIVFEGNPESGGSSIASVIWRLEDDRKSWRKLCVGLMKGSRLHEVRACIGPKLHPGTPEVVFFTRSNLQIPFDPDRTTQAMGKLKTGKVLSCNLKTGGELELFADLINFTRYWNLFQVEFSCWPTSIPRYEELRVMYDGSHSGWVQRGDTTPPSIAGTYYF